MLLDLNAIRQRAQSRENAASPANAANWLMPEPAPISQLARLAMSASENRPVQSLCEALGEAINRACDVRGGDDAIRAGLLAESAALTAEAQADLLAHFTVEAARWVPPASDARVTCTTCANYRMHRCGNHGAAGLQSAEMGRDMAALLQHCPGFNEARG